MKRNWIITLAVLIIIVGYFMTQQKQAVEPPKEPVKQETAVSPDKPDVKKEVSQAVDAVKETVTDKAAEVKEKVTETAGTATEAAKELAADVKDKAAEVAGATKEVVQETVAEVKAKTTEAVQTAKEAVQGTAVSPDAPAAAPVTAPAAEEAKTTEAVQTAKEAVQGTAVSPDAPAAAPVTAPAAEEAKTTEAVQTAKEAVQGIAVSPDAPAAAPVTAPAVNEAKNLVASVDATVPAVAGAAAGVAAATAPSTEPSKGVVKVGYLAAMTGDWAAYGQTEVRAATMAVEEINASGGAGGLTIELIPYDFRTRAEDAVNAVRRMIEQDKVSIIVGCNGSGINIATAPVVNHSGVSQIGTVTTNPLVTVDEKGNVRPYSFRICFTDPYQGKLIANFAAVELKKMNAAILYDVGSDYSQGLREFFMKSYGEYGGRIVADLGFRAGQDVDFRAQITEIRDKGADVLILPNMGKEMALIMKQARELGLKDMVFVGGDGYGEFMWEIAGSAMEGSYWINHVAPEDPAMAPFFAAYKARWDDECKEFTNGVLGYDAVYLAADAIRRAGSADPKLIRDALEATKDLKLHHATITMDPATHNPFDKDGVVLIAKDGKGQFYMKVKP